MSRYAVWVIDDEQGICTSLSFALKKKYEVMTFQSSAPAFDELERSRCDLILLDLRLGMENGLDVLQKIKAGHPDVTVIVMTAYGSIDTSVEAMKLGAFTYLTKPLKLNELDVQTEGVMLTLDFTATSGGHVYIHMKRVDGQLKLVQVDPAELGITK